MLDADAGTRDLISTLRDAQRVVAQEMTAHLQAWPGDRQVLLCLRSAVRGLGEQADTLVVTLMERGAEKAMIEVADELSFSFIEAEELIEKMLRLGRRQARGRC